MVMTTRARVKKVLKIETILLSWTALDHRVIYYIDNNIALTDAAWVLWF
jgi:hypothetical protein